MAGFTVVYDACVLYPPSVRDLLVELARTGLCRAKWTQRIHQEWIGAVMIGRADGDRARFERIAALMNAAVLNLRDFPESALSPFGISAVHPDVFVEHLLDLNAEAVCEAVRRIRRRLAAPPLPAEELLAAYESRGLAISASILRGHAGSL